MPRLSKEFKHTVEELPLPELQKLVLKAAARYSEFYDSVNLHYVPGKYSKEELFDDVKENVLGEIYSVSERGIIQKNFAKVIGKAIKHINHYAKVRFI